MMTSPDLSFGQQFVEEHTPPIHLAARLARKQGDGLRQDRAAHSEPLHRLVSRDEVEVTPRLTDEITEICAVEMDLEARHQSCPRGFPP